MNYMYAFLKNMGLLADTNVLKIWDEAFVIAQRNVSEIHYADCCYDRWTEWTFSGTTYKVFVLIRNCRCGAKINRLNKYKGWETIAVQHFSNDGLEVHIDGDKRCHYFQKRLPDDTFKLDKICFCPDTRKQLQQLQYSYN